jgi:hypothetical protein
MIAILDMEMPESCMDCDFLLGKEIDGDENDLQPMCMANHKKFMDDFLFETRHEDCPLVEIVVKEVQPDVSE